MRGFGIAVGCAEPQLERWSSNTVMMHMQMVVLLAF